MTRSDPRDVFLQHQKRWGDENPEAVYDKNRTEDEKVRQQIKQMVKAPHREKSLLETLIEAGYSPDVAQKIADDAPNQQAEVLNVSPQPSSYDKKKYAPPPDWTSKKEVIVADKVVTNRKDKQLNLKEIAAKHEVKLVQPEDTLPDGKMPEGFQWVDPNDTSLGIMAIADNEVKDLPY